MKENNGITASHEDLIYKNRAFIQEFGRVQDLYYDTLKNELELSDKAEEFLFDYIFNSGEEISFEEYLTKFGAINSPNIVSRPKFGDFAIYKTN
jgi:hypothetical protein